MNKRITVLTPTYNRGYILHNLYESLCKQTFLDFEWLIIDDGSTDETEGLVHNWKKNAPFSIRYYWKKNGGKHRAVNFGLDLAYGVIFFVVDSDDYLTSDALQKVSNWFYQIEAYPDIVGIVANRGSSVNETVNNFFAQPFLDKTLLEMNTYKENNKYVLNGERAIAFYTDFHKNYKYPEFDNENFLTEAVVYNRMAHDGYKMRFYNDIIWIFEYHADGLSSKGADIYLRNPKGYGLWFRERAEFLNWSLFRKWKMWYSFYCDLKGKYSVNVIANCIGTTAFNITVCKMVFLIHHFGEWT